MTVKTLSRRGNPLADTEYQLSILEPEEACSVPRFQETLSSQGLEPFASSEIKVLQVNVGKLCNQTCSHCHVDAGPDRREVMTRETLQACLSVIAAAAIETVDITGGAPEMNPHFEWFVTEVRGLSRHVIDRCNLTILTAPGFTHLPDFLAGKQVEIIASLPCYLEENCDRQRGSGVFRKSVAALRQLNQRGYGMPDSGLVLSLVYNPVGPSLPPDQQTLEAAYREQLRSRFGIEFTRLYTITNMPISRFLDDLLRQGRYEDYMRRLVAAFNPAAALGVMCRTMLSVDWRGRLYDCDFNQMLNLPVADGFPATIQEFDARRLTGRPIVTGRHCYGCTAGSGSSCQGSLVSG